MRAENWTKQDLEIEGWPVKITSYRLGDSHITEIEDSASGAKIARAATAAPAESREQAIEAASRRLRRTRLVDLTVGG